MDTSKNNVRVTTHPRYQMSCRPLPIREESLHQDSMQSCQGGVDISPDTMLDVMVTYALATAPISWPVAAAAGAAYIVFNEEIKDAAVWVCQGAANLADDFGDAVSEWWEGGSGPNTSLNYGNGYY